MKTERYLFRGKRVDSVEFVTGDLIHGVGGKWGRMFILPITHIMPKGCSELDGWEVIPDSVGQFTGLTDKNGVKIFEGDILAVEHLEGTRHQARASIEYDSENAEYTKFYPIGAYIVIGNIHDHANLLDY